VVTVGGRKMLRILDASALSKDVMETLRVLRNHKQRCLTIYLRLLWAQIKNDGVPMAYTYEQLCTTMDVKKPMHVLHHLVTAKVVRLEMNADMTRYRVTVVTINTLIGSN
jgi:hypothetical protein